jgi:hypothetical protein
MLHNLTVSDESRGTRAGAPLAVLASVPAWEWLLTATPTPRIPDTRGERHDRREGDRELPVHVRPV